MTREDPQEPALHCDAGSFFYESFLEDYRLAMRQARQLPADTTGVPFEELNTTTLRAFLERIDLYVDLNDEDLEDIIERAKSTEDPYG